MSYYGPYLVQVQVRSVQVQHKLLGKVWSALGDVVLQQRCDKSALR